MNRQTNDIETAENCAQSKPVRVDCGVRLRKEQHKMANKHLALQICNSLQRYGVQADVDALFDVIYETIEENSVDMKPTIRDQFAMHILPSLMLRWKEPGYTEYGAVAEAYSIANFMMECRVI